ncbi:MAG: right-handed parallel beta-helix repeat-containing protein [Thermomicrobiales bacterium]
MDAAQFDQVARRVSSGATRRRVVGALSGAAVASLLGAAVGTAKKKPKKKPYCLNGQTVQASGKKGKKLRKQGATPGACCVPTCNGTTCGGDGCGGTCGCAAGSVCNAGACAKCTVTCSGAPTACGTQLQQALFAGGTVVACPGRYEGAFGTIQPATLIGAGPGDDPATNTILVGAGSTVATLAAVGSYVFKLSGVKLTGAPARGLYISDNVAAQVSNCTIAGNNGGGILVDGALQLANSTVRDNASPDVGAGIYFYRRGPHTIDNCVISGNVSTAAQTFDGGGGIFTYGNASVTISGTEIRGNQAKRGGGIAMETGTVRLDSATSITGNTATETGGGVARQGGDFLQNGARISGNNSPVSSTANCAGVPGGCS